MTLNSCDWCGQCPAVLYCGACGLLLCDAHGAYCCPDCGDENLTSYRADQKYEPDDSNQHE